MKSSHCSVLVHLTFQPPSSPGGSWPCWLERLDASASQSWPNEPHWQLSYQLTWCTNALHCAHCSTTDNWLSMHTCHLSDQSKANLQIPQGNILLHLFHLRPCQRHVLPHFQSWCSLQLKWSHVWEQLLFLHPPLLDHCQPFSPTSQSATYFYHKKETWSDNLLHSQIAANLKGLPHHASRILQSFITGHAVARMTPQGYAIDSQLRTSMAVMQVEKEQPSGYLFPATVLHLTSLNCSIRPLTCQCLLSMPLPFSLFAFLPIHLTPSAPLPSKTCLQFKAQLHFSPPLTLLTVKVCISLDLTWVVFSGSCTIFIDSLKMVFLSTALIASTSHFPIKGDYVWKKDDSWTSRHSCIYAALHIHQKNPKPCHHLWEHQSPSNAWWASPCGCQLLNCPAAWSLKGRNGNETKFFLRHLDLESEQCSL